MNESTFAALVIFGVRVDALNARALSSGSPRAHAFFTYWKMYKTLSFLKKNYDVFWTTKSVIRTFWYPFRTFSGIPDFEPRTPGVPNARARSPERGLGFRNSGFFPDLVHLWILWENSKEPLRILVSRDQNEQNRVHELPENATPVENSKQIQENPGNYFKYTLLWRRPLKYALNIYYSTDEIPRLFKAYFITQTRVFKICQNILELYVIRYSGPFNEHGEPCKIIIKARS